MIPTNEILAATKANAIRMIKSNLEINDKWVLRAVLAIYANQTHAEQNTESTQVDNGIGFNGLDAQILSSFAKQIIDFENGKSRYMSPLSPKQMGIARRKITKYAGQLLTLMKAKEEAKKVVQKEGWDVLLVN